MAVSDRVYWPGLLLRAREGIAEFAAANLVMPEGRAAGRPLTLLPFQRGIVGAIEDLAVEMTVLRCSSQVGKSTVALAVIGHAIGERPASVLYVAPTETAVGGAFSRERLQPMIRDSPVLAAKFRGLGGRGAAAKLSRIWEGGSLAIVGANSAASLGARAVEVLLLDEIDKYPREAGKEGDVVAQALQRTVTFGRRRRVLFMSTPAGAPLESADDASAGEAADVSPIEARWALGDRCNWVVACPGCGRRGRVTWDTPDEFHVDREAAAVACRCGKRWSEDERIEAIHAGEWVRGCPPAAKEYRSFGLWSGESPYVRLPEVVGEYVDAESKAAGGDFAPLRAWWQLKRGLPFDDSVLADRLPEIQQLRAALVARAGMGGDPPAGAVRTAGLDVQADRVEALLVAWGEGEECWILEHRRFAGDPAEPGDECWDDAAAWLRERGVVRASCDSRYQPDAAALFCERTGAAATKGRADGAGEIVQRPKLPDPPKAGGRRLDRGARATIPYWPIGTNGAKRLVMSRLARAEPGPGHVRIPAWFDAASARQLVSEREAREVDKRGRVRRFWEQINRRNELLDMFILAIHAFRRKR